MAKGGRSVLASRASHVSREMRLTLRRGVYTLLYRKEWPSEAAFGS